MPKTHSTATHAKKILIFKEFLQYIKNVNYSIKLSMYAYVFSLTLSLNSYIYKIYSYTFFVLKKCEKKPKLPDIL